MKAIKHISDPEVFKLLADDTRRKILNLLRAKELTVGKIAGLLELAPQTIYHHIRKLEDGGLIESTREERISANLTEKYYQATAETFYFSLGEQYRSESAKRLVNAAVLALGKLGFEIDCDDAAISKLTDLQIKVDNPPHVAQYMDAISRLEDVDQVTKYVLERYVAILSMSEEEFRQFVKALKEFSVFLRSMLKKKRTKHGTQTL